MKIGIVIGSVRDQRKGDAVGKWVYDFALSRNDHDVVYELIDLKAFDLPFLGVKPTAHQHESIGLWSQTMAHCDGYIFITPEFNRLISGAFKNALEYLTKEVHDKACGYVSYGGLGGLSAIQSMRLLNAEQEMASVRTMVTFSIMTDFDKENGFVPASYHLINAHKMFDQLLKWSRALQTIRT